MEKRPEVDIQVIVHATEDLQKILGAFKDVFDIDPESFSSLNVQGHYENPIILLSCKVRKKAAKKFLQVLVSKMPKDEMQQIRDDLDEICDKSAMHLRISKQSLVRGKIEIADIDPVKLKIYTPIYVQRDLIKTYAEILAGKI